MKIIENTPDELVLRSRPILQMIAFWAVGLATIALGTQTNATPDSYLPEITMAAGAFVLFFAWRALPFVTLSFDRPSESVTRKEWRIGGTVVEKAPLQAVRSAKVGAAPWRGAFLRRLTLVTEEGTVPLENGFVGMPRERLARRINEWLGGVSRV